jgi:hypothetical protein
MLLTQYSAEYLTFSEDIIIAYLDMFICHRASMTSYFDVLSFACVYCYLGSHREIKIGFDQNTCTALINHIEFPDLEIILFHCITIVYNCSILAFYCISFNPVYIYIQKKET